MKQSLLAVVFVLFFFVSVKAQNVGVGTNAPASKLEVKGLSGDESSTGTLRLTNGTGSTELRFGTLDGTRSWLQTSGSLPLFINRLGNDVILNETAGNVGIGTSTPVQKVEVNGRTVLHNGGSTYNNANAAEVQIGYALASSGSVGEVARLALQPFGHTGGPFVFFNRDIASSAYLDLRYGTDNLLSVVHNGNIGIGTQNPASKLHVMGTGYPQLIIDQANGHSVLDIRTTDASNFNQSIRFFRGGVQQGEIYTSGGDQKLRFFVNGSDRMLIDNTGKVQIPALNTNSAVYTDGSRNLTTSAPTTGALGYWTRSGSNLYPTTLTDLVGIGVTAPATILDVRRPDNSNGDAIAFGTQSYVMGRLGETSSTNKVYIANTYNHDESYIDFRLKGNAEANSKMVIKGNGNVGIGTTNPGTYRLNVQAGSQQSVFESTNDAQLELKGTNEWAGLKWSDVGGTDYTWFWGATKTWAIGGGGSTVSGKKLHIHGGTSIGSSYVQSSVPSEGLAVQGNVGIGTNSPSAKLHVTGGGAILGTTSSGSVNRTFTILNEGQSQISFGDYPWDWSPALQIQNNDNTRFIWINPGGSSAYNFDSRFYAANSGLDFFTGSNAFAATLTAAGRLGIGTEDPAQKLDVQGGYAMISDIQGGDNQTKAFIEGGNGIAYFGALGTQRAVFGNVENWETLVADNTNIGIGTSSPGYRLDVQGASGLRIGNSTYDANLVFGNSGASWKSGIRVYDNGLAEMRIWHIQNIGKIILATGYDGDQSTVMPSDGIAVYANRLGVGTFTPSYKLQVAGQVYAATGNALSDYSTVNAIFEQTNSTYNAGITLRNTVYGDGGVLFGRSNSGGINAGSITSWTNYVGMYASNFTTQSDITVKKDVDYLDSNDYESCLDQIRNIQSIRYRYLSESATKEEGKQYRPHLHLGVVAQTLPAEVVDTMDRYASGPEGGQILGVSLSDMDGLMVAGMKALDQKNRMLEKQIEELKQEIEELKKK